MSNIEKVNDYLTECGLLYVSTVNGDAPKCRPMGFHMLVNDKIYFCTGTFKETYKQLKSNPKIEIVGTNKDQFIRYYGKAVFDENPEISNKAREALPLFNDMYNEGTGLEMAMFYLTDAKAEIRSMMKVEETIEL